MSELKDKLTKEVEEIEQTISNPEEKAKVLKAIQEMIGDFTKHIITLTERQNEIEEKVTEIYDVLTDLEEELVRGWQEDLQGECPYCGEIIPFEFENEEGEYCDFECPKCHNVIEIEALMNEHHCDCNCEDCGDDNHCDGSCDECGDDDHCDCGCEDCTCDDNDE